MSDVQLSSGLERLARRDTCGTIVSPIPDTAHTPAPRVHERAHAGMPGTMLQVCTPAGECLKELGEEEGKPMLIFEKAMNKMEWFALQEHKRKVLWHMLHASYAACTSHAQRMYVAHMLHALCRWPRTRPTVSVRRCR